MALLHYLEKLFECYREVLWYAETAVIQVSLGVEALAIGISVLDGLVIPL